MTDRARAATIVLFLALAYSGCTGSSTPSAPTAGGPSATPAPVSGPLNLPGYTVTASSGAISPGGELSVSWAVPTGGALDWVGLFHVSALCTPGTDLQGGWWDYTSGKNSGTLTLRAPALPGQYHFRYYRDDGCVEATRSTLITVSAN